MTDPVAITFAIPAYKRPGSVQTLLMQLQAQADPQDEILVSDDGLDDETAAVVNAAAGVRLLRPPARLGMVGNWNACLSAATRPWICILHDDDRLAPGAVDTLRRACALAAGPALVAHEPFLSGGDNTFRCRFDDAGGRTVLKAPEIPSGVVVHQEVVAAVGKFDPHFSYSPDLEYFARICARYPLVTVENPKVVNIRYHEANYQFETWRQPDFFSQFEELRRTIISYAGLKGAEAEKLLVERLTDSFSYMFTQARFWRDRDLMRLVGRRLLFRRGLNLRYRLVVCLAAATGWTTRPKTPGWMG